MAVGLELLGQQVQCPTCNKVIIAPASAPAPSPPAPAATSSSGSNILFELSKQEDTDSIFGEVQDEDVFGSRLPKVEIPEGPPLTPPPERPASNFATFAPGMPPTPAANGKAEPPAAPDPAAALGPSAPVPAETPVAAPQPILPAGPASVAAEPEAAPWMPRDSGSNQWKNVTSSEPNYASDAHIEKAEIRRPTQTREQRKLSSLMLAILGPYSVIMTVLAGYYFIKFRHAVEEEHPFAKIPDIRAQFDPAVRRQFTATLQKMPSPDADLPDKLKVQLGSTIRIGDLEVTPEKVEQGKLTQYTVFQNNQMNPQALSGEALIMHLRLKNVSTNIDFCPTDPFFDRYYDRRGRSAKPYMLLDVHGHKYYGGPIDFLAIDWKQVKRKFIDGQDNDDKPLPPGEERRTVVCSDPSDQAALMALSNLSSTDPITWRVQLRHGLTEFQGKEYSVTGVIGVQFTAADIKKRN
jgi:hypothetical protein